MKFIIQSSNEKLENHAGLLLAGKIISTLDLDSSFNVKISESLKEPKISNADVLRAYIGLLVLGRTAYEDIELFRKNRFFRRALNIKYVASAETLRQRIDASKGAFDVLLKHVNVCLLQNVFLTGIRTNKHAYMPVDSDVSPMNNSKTKKEGVGRTYKGMDGYAPNFVYIGQEGYMLNCELRPGIQHCQKGTPEFLEQSIELLKSLNFTDRPLFRMDSGNDAKQNVELIREAGYDYIIKRNLRKESLEKWLEIAKKHGVSKEPRPGKTVYYGTYLQETEGTDETQEALKIVFEVTVRTITATGECLLLPEIEADTYWTSVEEEPETVIDLYHQHGTSEQFHSELKSDMDVERLPSGKFKSNATILQMAMLGFNMLRKIGQNCVALTKKTTAVQTVSRWRLRTVLQNVMFLACKYVERSRQYFVKINKMSPWFFTVKELYARL